MPSLSLRRRRDPRWEEDGPSARREHRRRRLVTLAAFATSLVALGLSAALWVAHLAAPALHG